MFKTYLTGYVREDNGHLIGEMMCVNHLKQCSFLLFYLPEDIIPPANINNLIVHKAL